MHFSFYLLQKGIYVCGILMGPIVVLSGVILPRRDAPDCLKWTFELIYTRFGMRCLYQNIFLNREPMDCSKPLLCYFREPAKFLKFKDMEGNGSMDYWTMLGFLLLFRTIAYFVLYFNTARKR